MAKHDKPTIYEHQVLLFIARKTEEKVVNWPQSLLRKLRHLVSNISIINSLQSFGQRAEDSTSLRRLPQLALQKYLCTDEGKGQACFTKTADQELQPISNFGSPGGNCAKLGREHNCFWTWQCKGQTIAGCSQTLISERGAEFQRQKNYLTLNPGTILTPQPIPQMRSQEGRKCLSLLQRFAGVNSQYWCLLAKPLALFFVKQESDRELLLWHPFICCTSDMLILYLCKHF